MLVFQRNRGFIFKIVCIKRVVCDFHEICLFFFKDDFRLLFALAFVEFFGEIGGDCVAHFELDGLVAVAVGIGSDMYSDTLVCKLSLRGGVVARAQQKCGQNQNRNYCYRKNASLFHDEIIDELRACYTCIKIECGEKLAKKR